MLRLALLTFCCLIGFAQDRVVIDIIGEPLKKSKMAVPDFKLDDQTGTLDQAWSTLNQVLRKDLDNSGFFEILSKERMALIRGPHVGPIDFAEWSSIEAQHLVVGSVGLRDGGLMRVEVRLYEVASQQVIIAKAYKSKAALARKTAHIIADDIMLHLRNSKFATSKIVYSKQTQKEVRGEPRIIKEIWLMDYDGYNPVPITQGGLAVSPTAIKTEDSTMLAYCVYENAYTFNASYGIYLKPNLVSRPRPLFSQRGRRATSPAISPDGRKVIFSLAEEGNVDIYVMNLDGTDLLRLTRHPGIDTNPSWAPGGRAVLFTSDRTGSPQIYRMDADGLNLRRITQENPYNDLAVWNPHYDLIAYTSRFENNFDVFVMDLKDGRNYRLTKGQGSNEDPHWSPDGERLVFTSNRTGSWQLYSINRNGENLVQLTRDGNNRTPVWVD